MVQVFSVYRETGAVWYKCLVCTERDRGRVVQVFSVYRETGAMWYKCLVCTERDRGRVVQVFSVYRERQRPCACGTSSSTIPIKTISGQKHKPLAYNTECGQGVHCWNAIERHLTATRNIHIQWL